MYKYMYVEGERPSRTSYTNVQEFIGHSTDKLGNYDSCCCHSGYTIEPTPADTGRACIDILSEDKSKSNQRQ